MRDKLKSKESLHIVLKNENEETLVDETINIEKNSKEVNK